MTPQDIIDEARKWIGTPFHHQGRVLGAGVDCLGLVIEVARGLGISDYQLTTYGRTPDPVAMGKGLNEQLIKTDKAVPGSVLWFAFGNAPMHLGIVSDIGLIHAFSTVGRVVETGLDQQWIDRARGVFLFPGVDY